MAGNAQETRKRILIAAHTEFAERGIAGARIDRIAAMAGANKSLIYAYFGNKDDLLTAVFDAHVVATLEAVPFDAGNLPDYAARLFDYYRAKPGLSRLATWARLERSANTYQIEAIVAANRSKTDAIAAAQQAGQLSRRFPPAVLLGLVLSIASVWNDVLPEYGAALAEVGPFTHEQQRDTIVAAVKLLVEIA
ncbi:MAG TPA: TetR family transcriptional regulator [Devosiaceae bacterium]|jgi:AcrR family transcriptional regulator